MFENFIWKKPPKNRIGIACPSESWIHHLNIFPGAPVNLQIPIIRLIGLQRIFISLVWEAQNLRASGLLCLTRKQRAVCVNNDYIPTLKQLPEILSQFCHQTLFWTHVELSTQLWNLYSFKLSDQKVQTI